MRRLGTLWLIGLTVVGFVVGGVAVGGCGQKASTPAFEPPRLEAWSGEAQVAQRIEELRRRAAADPTSATLVGRLGMAFHAHALFPQAAACYRQAAALAPEEGRWPYLAALAVAKTDPAAALPLFAAADERGLASAAAHIHHGDILSGLGDQEQAAAQYRAALEINARSSHALYGLARLAMAAGEPSEARSLLEKAASFSPNHGEVHGLLAQVYRTLGLEEEAQEQVLLAAAYPDATTAPDAIFAAVEKEAVSSTALVLRGRRLAEGGQFAEAEKLFRRVLEIRPGNARDFTNLGAALAAQGKVEEAVAQYDRALALDADDPVALSNLAMARADKGDLALAADTLLRAIAVDPAYAEGHRNLGSVRMRQNRPTEALEHFRQALALRPGFIEARNDLAGALASGGDLDGAREQWRQVLAIDSRDLSALYNLSRALASRGEHGEAIRHLRQGLAVAPNSSRLASALAWELATAPDPSLRNGQEAQRLAARALKAYPEEMTLLDIYAAALAESGDFTAAQLAAEKALASAQRRGAKAFAKEVAARLALYRQQRPFHQPG
jgi:tetratricopeptide (TPR) repeat protein